MTLRYEPGAFDGTDVAEGYESDEDSGFSSSIENIKTYTGPYMAPGEYWEVNAKLTLSTDPSEIVFLEFRTDGGDEIIARSVIDAYGIPQAELNLTVPTYVVNGDFSGPASGSAGLEVRVNNVAGETFNYFVNVQALRLRDEIDTTLDYQHSGAETFDSGGLF